MRTLVLLLLFIINDQFQIITEVSGVTQATLIVVMMGVIGYDVKDFIYKTINN